MSRIRKQERLRTFRITGLAIGVAGALVLGGCASGQYQAPTHKWVPLDQVSGVEYRIDNNQCARETLGESGPRVLKSDTVAYSEYVNCMNERGYVLTAYSDEKAPR